MQQVRDAMKVLLVEDEASIRRVTIRILRKMFDDVDPWVAESADQAIDYLREAVIDRPFDLIICDWDLLGTRTGGDVLEWIREHASQLERRFIFFTANDDALAMRAPWTILKPADVLAIQVTIQAATTVLTDQKGH